MTNQSMQCSTPFVLFLSFKSRFMKNTLKLILACSLGSIFNAQAIDVNFHRAELPVLIGEELNHVGYIEVIKSANEKEAIKSFS